MRGGSSDGQDEQSRLVLQIESGEKTLVRLVTRPGLTAGLGALGLLASAVVHAQQFDGVVLRPTDELPRIRWVELDATDARAATNVSFQ